LARALRVDKLTLAGLEATLRLYRDPEVALKSIPTLRYLTRSEAELKRLAHVLARGLRGVLPSERFAVSVVAEHSEVGGGSLPGEALPTFCVALKAREGRPRAEAIAHSLRQNTPSIFARIQNEETLFDPRTLEVGEMREIVNAAIAFRTL
jgi:L-seryl-tRNA(Ser) seleniumtransferase